MQAPLVIRILALASSSPLIPPGICDPGAQLAASCAAHGVPLHPIPGASAVTAALSVSGFNGSAFTFFGFLPFRGSEKQKLVDLILTTNHIVVFFEAPHRVLDTFNMLVASGQGDRSCLCAREITKIHEEFKRGSVRECNEFRSIMY